MRDEPKFESIPSSDAAAEATPEQKELRERLRAAVKLLKGKGVRFAVERTGKYQPGVPPGKPIWEWGNEWRISAVEGNTVIVEKPERPPEEEGERTIYMNIAELGRPRSEKRPEAGPQGIIRGVPMETFARWQRDYIGELEEKLEEFPRPGTHQEQLEQLHAEKGVTPELLALGDLAPREEPAMEQ